MTAISSSLTGESEKAKQKQTRKPAAARLPSTLSIGLARARIEVLQFFRRRDAMVFIFAFPLILLFIFGSVFNNDVAPGVSFTQYFAAGMIASGVALTSFQSLAIAIAIERDNDSLKRLRGTPMPPLAYFLGKIGVVLVPSVVQTVLLIAVGALAFNLSLPSDPMLWLRFVWVFVLGTAAGTVLGIAYSSVPRSASSAIAVVSPVVIILQFISGVFFVFTQLPGWMQTIGAVFPLKWLAQGMRSVFLPASFAHQEASHTWQLLPTAVILGAWTVVGLALCLGTFRWQRSRSR
jgi:ABC-2 type transport system permease protein